MRDTAEVKSMNTPEHVEQQTEKQEAEDASARQLEYERGLSFATTLRVFWRSTLWILYGQLVVFGYGIDGIIAGYLLAIPRFR